jgi:hypothetical protein
MPSDTLNGLPQSEKDSSKKAKKDILSPASMDLWKETLADMPESYIKWWTENYDTIHDISVNFNNNYARFYPLLANFLDMFYHQPPYVRAKMIKDPPLDIPAGRHYVPRLAATAHKLANDFGLEVPFGPSRNVAFCLKTNLTLGIILMTKNIVNILGKPHLQSSSYVTISRVVTH